MTSRRLIPSLTALRALETLDRLGSASAVAEEMSLTQSAISRQLKTLEDQLGANLIIRDRKRLTLTPAAQDYVVEVRQALNAIAQASLGLQVKSKGGSVNLAILPAFGMRWLVPRLPEFTQRHPDVTINMLTQLKPFNFAREPFDAALHFGNADWPGTNCLPLRSERVIPVCAPELVREGRPAPSDMPKLPLLHIETRPNAWSDWFDAVGVDAPAPLTGVIHDQFATITQAALHGLGVGLMPDYLVEQDLATGNLVALYDHPIEASGQYYLVWPQHAPMTAALRHFRDWLAQKSQPEDDLPR